MKYLTIDEFKTMLRAVPAEKPLQRLMFLVGFWHGLRVSELVGLTGRQIQHGYIDVQRLKGSLRTVQPYVAHPDPELDEAKALRELAALYQGDERLFKLSARGVQDLMARIAARTGLNRKKMHPHVLKHSIAMHSIKIAGIENVRTHLGHKSLSSTGFYLKQTDDGAMSAVASALGAV